ncbi:zinc finger protein 184-like [Chrysoperla carnea]|uniref:zinc finger protein 184-like n=1 Tax=Chrysoperla carnea TaxID=189513 RepID=UPI001D071FE1|nr:zinc finger protein 184-like [Chrysoperla carnea]
MDSNNIKVDTSPDHENKFCFVPSCRSTTYTNPEKHFIFVPKNDAVRKQWCIAANCPDKRLQTVSYCCEDHFNLEEDLENYFYVKTVPNAQKILKKGVVPRFFNTANTATTSKNTIFTEIFIKTEPLDDNVTMEVGQIKSEIPDDGSNDFMEKEILKESIYENDKQFYTINYENIKVKEELHTEQIFKNETFDENIRMEVDPIKNEIQEEEDSHDIDSDSVVSVKHEPVHENVKHSDTNNDENIELEKELHTELIIKNETFDGNVVKKVGFSCNICNRTFTYQHSLVRHERIHSGEKPFSCDICNKKFSQQHHFVTHKRIHSGETQFRGSLAIHQRIHSEEKPFSCDICKKTFSDQRKLVTHIRIHNVEKTFSCDICYKTFAQQGYLVSHKRTHSNS